MNTMPLETIKLREQSYLIEIHNFRKFIYEPSAQEIESYAKDAGLTCIKRIYYQTDTHRERWLYILS